MRPLTLAALCAATALAQNPEVAPATPAPAAEAKAAAARSTWAVRGGAQFLGLLVSDADPANDRAMVYWARAELKPMQNATAFLRLGVLQEFVVGVDRLSPFDLQDTTVGFEYGHALPAELPYLGRRDVRLSYSAQLFLPTSQASRYQDLIVAPEARAAVGIELFPRFELGVDLSAQWRWHRYAERAGLYGGMNTQYVFGLEPSASFRVFEHSRYGTVSVSADASRLLVKKYGSRETYLSGSSDAQLWLHRYGWGLGVSYRPKQWLSASLSVSQNANVLRDGLVNVVPLHRDETQLLLGVSGHFPFEP